MARQPDLDTGRRIDLGFEYEVTASRHGRSWADREATDQPAADGDAVDRSDEFVTDPRHGDDDLTRLVAQRPTQFENGVAQNLVDAGTASPYRLFQFLPGQHLSGVPQELGQHLQRLVLEFDRNTVDAQFELRLIEFCRTESVQVEGDVQAAVLGAAGQCLPDRIRSLNSAGKYAYEV
jgi:hypothetical protein